MLEHVADDQKRRHIGFVQNLADAVQVVRRVAGPIEVNSGPVDELAVHRPRRGQTDPSLGLGVGNSHDHATKQWRQRGYIDVTHQLDFRKHREILALHIQLPATSTRNAIIETEKAKAEGVPFTRPLPSLATRPSRPGRGLASAQVGMPSVVFLNG